LGISKRPRRIGIVYFLCNFNLASPGYLFPKSELTRVIAFSSAFHAEQGYGLAGIKFNDSLLVGDRLDFIT
jgi:hypothetical protein